MTIAAQEISVIGRGEAGLARGGETPYLSLVIPAYNEEEVIPALLSRVESALLVLGRPFEVIVVDDGSMDGTAGLLAEGRKRYSWLRVLRMGRNGGQSAAFDAGFKAARGQVIATIDADLQNDPEEIPRLLPMLDAGPDGRRYDMITGWRRDRHDTRFRRMQTRVANRVRNYLSGETIEDSASSLKVYRRECLEGMQLYNGMHRFFPTLVKMRGHMVLETPVKHSPRFAGTPKYGLRNRAFRAFIDLLAVRWMKRRWIRYEVKEIERRQEQKMIVDGHVVGVCSWSLQAASAMELIRRVKETGLTHVQLHLNPLVMADDKRKHQELGVWRSGAEAPAITAGMISFPGEDYSTLETIHRTGGLAPDEGWPLRKALVKQASQLAAELGMRIVTFHCGFIPSADDPFYGTMVKRVSEVADEFAKAGVDALMETGQESAAALARFLRDTARANLGANFDPANMILYGSGNPIDAIHTLGPLIRHVHIKDGVASDQPGKTWGREVVFGSGEVGASRFLKALKEIGYSGPMCVEREAGGSRVDDVRAAIRALRACASPNI